MKFDGSDRTSNDVRLPMLGGSGELKKFLPASRTVNNVRSPKSDGIAPLN